MLSSEFIENLILSHNTYQELNNEILLFREYVIPQKEINKVNYSFNNLDVSKQRNFYCNSSLKILNNIINKLFNILDNDETVKFHNNKDKNKYIKISGIYVISNPNIIFKQKKNAIIEFVGTHPPNTEYDLFIYKIINSYLNNVHFINTLYIDDSKTKLNVLVVLAVLTRNMKLWHELKVVKINLSEKKAKAFLHLKNSFFLFT